MSTYAQLNVVINRIMLERGEWCGIPLPLKDCGLVLEDRHPLREFIAGLQAIMDGREPNAPPAPPVVPEESVGWEEANRWRSRYRGIDGQVVLFRHSDGRRDWNFIPDRPQHNALQLIGMFEALDAWNIRTEFAAIERLQKLLPERMFNAYVLTGSFLETSPQSGLTYIFRRLKPTVVMTPHRDPIMMEVLTCLCLHPIGYYTQSFCGAMTPTDDAIAHLMLMRADEHLFWKRANHHHPADPESGL